MDCTFNPHIAQVQPSASIVTMAKAHAMKAMDSTIIDLSSGEPDFDTPKAIRDELFRQIDAGYTHYVTSQGLPELRQRIAQKLQSENGCAYTADEIIVTPGGKFSIYVAVRTLIGQGDDVLYLTPGWVSYPSIVESTGGTPIAVELNPDDHYRLTLEALEAAYTPQTKLLILNYPNNPTGCILSPEEFADLKTFLLRHPDVLLLSDEIYERVVYDGQKSVSPGADPQIGRRVLTVNGFSKSVAMTGWRIGYLAADKAIVDVAMKLFAHTMSCTSGFVQKAATVAFDCDPDIEAMRVQYQARRDVFIGGLNQIPGVHCQVPEGAFYAWVNFTIPGMDDTQACEYILETAKVVGIPGIAYGDTKGCHVRFSFATSEAQLTQAVKNIAKAMASI